MLKALKLLLESKDVLEIKIIEWKRTRCVFYAKIEVRFRRYVLFIREYENTCALDRKYSYHLQDDSGNLIVRFDNAPHYRDVESFPHHIHREGRILPSFEVTSEEIVKKIIDLIKKSEG